MDGFYKVMDGREVDLVRELEPFTVGYNKESSIQVIVLKKIKR